MTDRNHLNDVMSIGHDLFLKRKIPWPGSFTKEMKINLLNGLIEYWTEVEDYEKCAGLQKVLGKINGKK